MQDDLSPPPTASDSGDNNPIFTLGELSQSLKKTVEATFDHVRVRAEVSRPVRAGSGHVYFTLKDDTATLDAVCWKTVAGSLNVQPEEGLEVIASGKLTTYPGRSKYQIVIKSLELAGEGALLKQLEERKQRLMAEGLFDADRKQPIPTMPMTIGVVTSPTGAVIRDILHRLKERFPVQVLVWPVLVQGEGAAAEITAAINGFDAMLDQDVISPPDLVIVARGGGSLEDLMAFNDEAVVRATAALRLPVISAVGHETDNTLIDLAADLRAPTPTAAAELATPVKAELDGKLADLHGRLTRHIAQRMERSGQQLRDLGRALGDPEMVLSAKTQHLDLQLAALDRTMESRLSRALERLRGWADRLPLPAEQLARAGARLGELDTRMGEVMGHRLTEAQRVLTRSSDRLKDPGQLLAEGKSRMALLGQRLDALIDTQLTTTSTRLDQASRLLEASSFQRVLDRGFALVTGSDGQVMRSRDDYHDGDTVMIRLSDGQRAARLGSDDDGAAPPSAPKAKKSGKDKPGDNGQGDLF